MSQWGPATRSAKVLLKVTPTTTTGIPLVRYPIVIQAFLLVTGWKNIRTLLPSPQLWSQWSLITIHDPWVTLVPSRTLQLSTKGIPWLVYYPYRTQPFCGVAFGWRFKSRDRLHGWEVVFLVMINNQYYESQQMSLSSKIIRKNIILSKYDRPFGDARQSTTCLKVEDSRYRAQQLSNSSQSLI